MIDKELLKSEAGKFNISLTAEQLEKFDLFARELVLYNKKTNLTAITDPRDIVIKHFVDSAAVLNFVKLSGKLADVGAGAGFPSIPLLIARDDLDVTIIESNKKKTDFIKYILPKLGLTAHIAAKRAEDAGRTAEYRQKFDFAISRAVGKLRILAELSIPLLKVGGTFLSMKGDITPGELSEGERATVKLGAKITLIQKYAIGDNEKRTLIAAEKLRPTDPLYPRTYSKIKNSPPA